MSPKEWFSSLRVEPSEGSVREYSFDADLWGVKGRIEVEGAVYFAKGWLRPVFVENWSRRGGSAARLLRVRRDLGGELWERSLLVHHLGGGLEEQVWQRRSFFREDRRGVLLRGRVFVKRAGRRRGRLGRWSYWSL